MLSVYSIFILLCFFVGENSGVSGTEGPKGNRFSTGRCPLVGMEIPLIHRYVALAGIWMKEVYYPQC